MSLPSRPTAAGVNGLGAWLNMLYGAEPEGSFVELRWRLRRGRGMARDFISIGDPRLPRVIEARGAKSDVFAGVAPRARQEGTRAAVERVHVLWCDLDSPEAVEAVKRFEPPPSMVVRSGTGRHAYWSLWPPATPDEAERANRRLAHALGGDPRSTDAARILRPPGTHNFKTGEPVRVVVQSINAEIFTAEDVAGLLPDPPARTVAPAPALTQYRGTDPLGDIAPAIYMEVLTGLVPDAAGKVCCPLPDHEDQTPSCQVYPAADRGWFCFGCERGGRVYDLAALLAGYRLPLRGSDFIAVRDVLTEHLGARAA